MNQRSLRNIVNQRVPKEDLSKLAAELRDMQDRSAAIVAATLVEDALENVLLSRMARLSKKEYERLFLVHAPVSTFSAKILVCRAFKLLDQTWAFEMNTIKDIRNLFAHARISVNFNTPEIVRQINEIRVIDRFTDPVFSELCTPLYEILKQVPLGIPRARFLYSCLFFSFMLSHFPPNPDYDLGEGDDEP